MYTQNPELIPCQVNVLPLRNPWREYLIRYGSITVISVLSSWFQLDYPVAEGGFFLAFLVSFVRTSLIWNGSMLIIQYSVNRYSMFRDTLKLIIFQVVTLTVYVFIVELGEILTVEYLLKMPLTSSARLGLVGISLLITFMISSIYASVSFFIQWKENLLRTQALEKANLEARYETLRNQVNPHFLFNSLNTLIMLVNDNPLASRYVESMAEIMRYMLNSRDKETVLLRDELTIAREYIFIQQNRFGDKLVVDFDVPEQFYHFAVPPLALQMLLENAIKHNELSRENPLHLSVRIVDKKYVVVENNIRLKTDKEPSTGIGLENIRNRYLFLAGKDIQVRQENGLFTVMLPLFEKSL